ncbi:hypothetical protein SAMN05878482_10962 [Peribacillus simplex]|uniref:Uncharacterized protein n=1 Tax=Peribacillus simplex TaxID=1478 RepID=A0A9X8RDL5_9BACI|nr:hypothetical protein [Peribacillus simplex]SIS01696.1 hypothetical protein SAMN05878482_10962 [Peribacillus simplex]
MGKVKHLNPVLSSSNKKTIEPQKKRKVRSDKLHDIKIPVDEPMDMILRRESRRYWNGSKTALGTEILLFGLEQVLVYPDVTYTDQPYTVHCKVDHETYQRIGDYAAGWKCSVRKAAHRIFIEAYKKRQLGGVTDGEI